MAAGNVTSSPTALSLTGSVTTFAGTQGVAGNVDGARLSSSFDFPWGLDADADGNLYVFDVTGLVLRKISPIGVVSTIAGSYNVDGYSDGVGAAATFSNSIDIAFCPDGNIYLADAGNKVVRKITPAGVVTTFAGLAGVSGSIDGVGAAARFTNIYGIDCDKNGNLYVVGDDDLVRKITTPGAVVTTYAGVANTEGSLDGPRLTATFRDPEGVTVDNSGNVYIADLVNFLIRKIDTSGNVTTIAGSPGVAGNVDGTGSAARFNWIRGGIVVDDLGFIYIADSSNHSIRKITPDGVVTTIAGGATSGYSDGVGAAAIFNSPMGIAILNGSLYVGDAVNRIIRRIQ